MPLYPPGTVVRVHKHLLRPFHAASALPTAENGAVSDLRVTGRASRDGRDVYVLKHASAGADLYAAKVTLQTAAEAAEAADAWEEVSEDEDTEAEADGVDFIDDDLFSDLLDESAVDAPTPPAAADASEPSPLIDWSPLGCDLHADIDGGLRSTRRARMRVDVRGYSPGALWRLLFPPAVAESAARATSPELKTPLDASELYGFLGLMMRCADDSRPRDHLWMPTRHSAYPSPMLGAYMPLRRFEAIAANLKLSMEAESDMDAVLQLVERYNEHMADVYESSATVCLDESKVEHTPSTRIPTIRSLPRKHAPTGSGFHTVCDAETRVMIKMELSRGVRDDDEPGVSADEAAFGRMGALALRMTRPFYGQGVAVVMNSALCGVATMLEMRRRGVFAATVVQKRRGWPRNLDGVGDLVETLKTKPVGELHARKGLSTADQLPIAHFLVNYGPCVAQFVSTYGCDVLGEEQRRVRLRTDGRVIAYRRNAVIDQHYQARLAVGLHNSVCQEQCRALEQTWASRKWPVRQLAFVVSAALVNAYFIYVHFCGQDRISFHAFRLMVMVELVEAEKARGKEHSGRLMRPSRSAEGAVLEHRLVRLNHYEGATPGKRTAKKYQQQRCRGRKCNALTRTYCACDRRLLLCFQCFGVHAAETK